MYLSMFPLDLDWGNEQKVDRYEVLRLIYQGRFLHGNVTLAALRLQQGKTTVMHLVPRENLPESNNENPRRKQKNENNHQDGANDNAQRTTPNHRSGATSPDSTEPSVCCDTCSIL